VERVAIFIVKGQNAIGWYARGFGAPDSVKTVSIPLSGDTVFRLVANSRHAERGHVDHTPGTAQALARLGGSPQGLFAAPLILRDKLAAVLYCDTSQDEVAPSSADLVEILASFAAKTIDLLTLAARPAAASGASVPPAAAERPAPAPAPSPRSAPPAPAPPPVVGPAENEGSSTVMFAPGTFTGGTPSASRPVNAPAARPGTTPPSRPGTAPGSKASPEEQKAHEDAKRFARLVVSEIKLYNETKVSEGRKNHDIYERLKEDIERGRQMYTDRVPANIREATNYFFDELVRILAGGDPGALGPM
jgi:hypothetical protein